MDDNFTNSASNMSSAHVLESYFQYPSNTRWLYTHILCAIIAWVMLLPLLLTSRTIRSRSTRWLQISFHAMNSLSMVAAIGYSYMTPSLYDNSCHGVVGWIAISCSIAWSITSCAHIYQGAQSESKAASHDSQRESLHRLLSRDEQDSPPTAFLLDPSENFDGSDSNESANATAEKVAWREMSYCGKNHCRSCVKRWRGSKKVFVQFGVLLALILSVTAFTAFVSGFVVWMGVFKDRNVFSGLAHTIKGAIFIWYGVITFARFLGAFSNYGWAWNAKPHFLDGSER